jgi:uncharacterized membrane protein
MTATVEDEQPSPAAGPVGHGRGDARAGYDVGRLLAFSDGVFAIAITLLVLGIPVPHVANHDQLPGELWQLSLNLVGFAVSFVLVGTQWIAHHRLLRQLDFANVTILWINLLLLMGICLVPFATSVLVQYGDVPPGAITYASLQAAIGVVFVGYRLYLVHSGIDVRHTLVLSWVPALAFVVSIPVALWSVNGAYAIWVIGFSTSRIRQSGLVPKMLRTLRRWIRSRS